jgi:hypothetical protein
MNSVGISCAANDAGKKKWPLGGASWEIIQDEEGKILASASSAPMPLL